MRSWSWYLRELFSLAAITGCVWLLIQWVTG